MNRTLYLVATLALAATGCEGLTTTAEPRVSVLRQTPDDCFALMTLSSPVDSALGISGTCSYNVDPTLVAGIDLVEVIVDYGPDVEFSGDTVAPPPTITLTLDGVPTTEPITIATEGRVGGRAYFVATLRAPAATSTDVRVTAGVDAGFQTTVPTVFTLVPPSLSFQLVDCAVGLACELPGAVGNAHFKLLVAGDLPQIVSLAATLGGVPEPALPDVTTQPSLDGSTGTFELPVPAAPDGTLWAVTASLPTTKTIEVDATIRTPMIAAQLSCGNACALAPGDPVGLQITAPAEIDPLQALVTTEIGGVPQLVAAPVALVPQADGTSTGVLALQAPATTGTWQISVSVAGYSAPAVTTTIQ